MIYFPGDKNGRVYLALSGQVRLYRSQGGEKVVIQVLGPGDFFGDLSFVKDAAILPSENYAQATQPTKACVIMADDLNRLLQKFPVLAMVMLVTLRNRLHQTESKIKDLALSSAQTRVINELIRYAALHGRDSDGVYEIGDRLTHQALAEMTGLTRETVTKTLNFLEAEGFVSYQAGRVLRLNRNKILNDCMDCIQLAKPM
ncbi:MAG: Crp/Fnr family transcriptional regulator [Candidatus Doudnabacteria bacterium]|nr:Crp/Fnr family transcriptional regulator [Candidatus Doudnabacteria bacterium]